MVYLFIVCSFIKLLDKIRPSLSSCIHLLSSHLPPEVFLNLILQFTSWSCKRLSVLCAFLIPPALASAQPVGTVCFILSETALFVLLRASYFPEVLIYMHSLCYFFQVTLHVSHPNITASKLTVFYSLMFRTVISR
jgi:hypothetical protein